MVVMMVTTTMMLQRSGLAELVSARVDCSGVVVLLTLRTSLELEGRHSAPLNASSCLDSPC